MSEDMETMMDLVDMSGFDDDDEDEQSYDYHGSSDDDYGVNEYPDADFMDFDDDDPLNATGVSRKSLVIFFLIDT